MVRCSTCRCSRTSAARRWTRGTSACPRGSSLARQNRSSWTRTETRSARRPSGRARRRTPRDDSASREVAKKRRTPTRRTRRWCTSGIATCPSRTRGRRANRGGAPPGRQISSWLERRRSNSRGRRRETPNSARRRRPSRWKWTAGTAPRGGGRQPIRRRRRRASGTRLRIAFETPAERDAPRWWRTPRRRRRVPRGVPTARRTVTVTAAAAARIGAIRERRRRRRRRLSARARTRRRTNW